MQAADIIWQLCTLDRYQYFTMASITGQKGLAQSHWHRSPRVLEIHRARDVLEHIFIHFQLNSFDISLLHQHCFTSEVLFLTLCCHDVLRDVDLYSLFNIFFRWVFSAPFPHNATFGPDRRKHRWEHFKVLKAHLKETKTLMFTLP